jgi:integrase
MPRRTAHPGITLIRPDAEHPTWRARYTDPDSGRTVKERLDPNALRNDRERRDWAIRKARSLAKRRMDLESGAPRATGTSVEDAVKRYYEDSARLRPGTLETYRPTTAKFLAWCAAHHVTSADKVDGPTLARFRAALVKEKRRVHYRGGKRGAVLESERMRSPATVNRELRAIGTVLSYLRGQGLLPRVTGDALRDSLKKLPLPVKRIEYQKPNELRTLLEAALRHDADTFKATRAEHAGEQAPGSTQRYLPIAPLVASAILTGMRRGELLALDWADVDLEALDHGGKAVGEIYVSDASKTKRARTVGLEVSPALRRLLAAMHVRAGRPKQGTVFGLSEGEAIAALRRLVSEYGAPAGSKWQAMRRTAGTFLTNSPGIFGAASAYRSAKQLGHSVQVAEKHYVDVMRGITRDARTLEAAMQIEGQVDAVIGCIATPQGSTSSGRSRRAE